MAWFDCCTSRETKTDHLIGVTPVMKTAAGPRPEWDSTQALSCGGDKDVFLGTLDGMKVAVCVPKATSSLTRLLDEVKFLNQVGQHPHIVKMLHHSTSQDDAYVACEVVEPIGFDLDRLARQYTFAGMSVPAGLTRVMLSQMCSGLDHMHRRGVVHRDIKTENVLVTGNYEAKIIDMGIACHIGHQEQRWVFSAKTYFAPELCEAKRQGKEIDAWGLGVILHQIYQHRWDILYAPPSKSPAFRCKRPSTEVPMESSLKEAMMGLLQLEPATRWTTENVLEAVPPNSASIERCSTGGEDWQAPTASRLESRMLLRMYKGSGAPLTAYAVVIDERNQYLVGKSLGELHFLHDFGAIVLMIDVPASAGTQRETHPNKDTVIPQNAWLYIGVHPSENTEDQISGLAEVLFPSSVKRESSACSVVSSSGRCTADKSGLMAFNLEFDCFTFPKHVGTAAVVGPKAVAGKSALNLRGNFGLNLAGILRPGFEPEWFPGPEAVVAAGDMGLVVRCPCKDGTTEPTVTDDQLQGLMDKNFYDATLSVGLYRPSRA